MSHSPSTSPELVRSANQQSKSRNTLPAPGPRETVTLGSSDDDSDDIRILTPQERAQERAEHRKRTAAHAVASAYPTASTSQPSNGPFPSDYPLPKISPEWNLKRYLPRRFRPEPKTRRRMRAASLELHGDVEMADGNEERDRTIMEIREEERKVAGVPWGRDWELVDSVAPRLKTKMSHDVAFFPFPNEPGLGLEYMDGVAAIVSGTKVELIQIRESDGGQTVVNLVHELKCPRECQTKDKSKEKAEELLAVAWSVRLDTWPYSPVLAVAGEGAKIFVYNIEPSDKGKTMLNVWLDRTLVGHGRRIWSLKFSSKHPHLLVSASDDRTVILWDPVVAGGSNEELFKACAARDLTPSPSRGAKPIPYSRPFVRGEVLAKLAEAPHAEPIFSVDIHPSLPLVVTGGADAYIKIWTIPSELLGPTWPAQPPIPSSSLAYRVKTTQIIGPPIFSSANLHSGQWITEVRFLSGSDASVVSRAQLSHTPAGHSSTLIRIWTADVLNPRKGRDDRAAGRMRAARDPLANDVCPDSPAPLAFKVHTQVDLTDPCYIGTKMGVHLKPSSSPAADGINETFFVLPTSAAPRALLSYTPNSLRQFGDLEHLPSRAEKFTALQRAQFPADRKRPMYDDFHRMSPAAVTELECDDEVLFRSIAIEPNGARYVLAVGDGGARAVWRSRRVEVKWEAKSELVDKIGKLEV